MRETDPRAAVHRFQGPGNDRIRLLGGRAPGVGEATALLDLGHGAVDAAAVPAAGERRVKAERAARLGREVAGQEPPGEGIAVGQRAPYLLRRVRIDDVELQGGRRLFHGSFSR